MTGVRGVRGAAAMVCLALGLAACGGPDEDAEVRPSRLVEFVVPEGCDLLPTTPRQLAGGYMRETEGPGVFEAIVLTGIEGTNALRADLRVDEAPVRPRPTGEIGSFLNTFPGIATPVSGLEEVGGARGYRLGYTGQDALPFTGLAVVGETPAGAEVPTAGRAPMAGPANLILRTQEGEDVGLSGRLSALIGYGSRTATLQLSDITAEDGRALPFTQITWRDLGLCGTRVVSTGQGRVRVTGPAGEIVTPFGRDGAPTAAVSTLNGFLTAPIAPGGAPRGAGGILLIQGDAASLRGGFAMGAGN